MVIDHEGNGRGRRGKSEGLPDFEQRGRRPSRDGPLNYRVSLRRITPSPTNPNTSRLAVPGSGTPTSATVTVSIDDAGLVLLQGWGPPKTVQSVKVLSPGLP